MPDLSTPHLVVDLDTLNANIAAMAAHAARLAVALRPHAKTHKCPDVAALQVAAGATGLTVATVAEAEVFAHRGFTDLFIAYPLWVDPARAARIRDLLETTEVTVGVDSLESGRALAAQLGDDRRRIGLLVEVDSGQHRSGVPPGTAGLLADQLAHTGLRVDGVFTFPGHGYSPGAGHRVAGEEADALALAAAGMRERGIEPRIVSGGSTPTAAAVSAGTLTELRPGVYVFGDAQQWELGTITPAAIALSCQSTVVSLANGNVVLDAGSKALGADRPSWATGHGRLLDHPAARITQLSEHHAVVNWEPGGRPPEIGSRLRVVPNHVCAAVNLADELVVVHSGAVVDRWPVAARGANT